MIRRIVTSRIFLSRPSIKATPYDKPIGEDLMDTFAAHRPGCVGMAANMIGAPKRIIAVLDEGTPTLMYNPKIVEKSDEYTATEGCLSLPDTREVTRYKRIRLQYQDENFKRCERDFEGYTAQIIQHEVDHCEGIIV